MDTLSSWWTAAWSGLSRATTNQGQPAGNLRVYALDRLRESGDWQEVHDRHAAYFLSLA